MHVIFFTPQFYCYFTNKFLNYLFLKSLFVIFFVVSLKGYGTIVFNDKNPFSKVKKVHVFFEQTATTIFQNENICKNSKIILCFHSVLKMWSEIQKSPKGKFENKSTQKLSKTCFENGVSKSV